LFVGLVLQAGWTKAIGSEPALTARPDSDSAVLKRILANWRAREERVKSFYFAWENRWTPPRHLSDQVIKARMELWMDGDSRFRLVYSLVDKNGPTASNPEKLLQPSEAVGWQYAFDGATSRRLDMQVDNAQGKVWNGMGEKRLDGISVRPLILALRPVSGGGIGQKSLELRLRSRNAIIGNAHCVKLQRVQPLFVENFWIDPARDDLIVGWERTGRQSPSAFASIEYRHDRKDGWVPSRWGRADDFVAGNPSSENTLIGFTMNETFPPNTFTLTFPPGTTVIDHSLKEEYLVAKDGSKTDVLKFDSPPALRIHQALEMTTDFTIDAEPLKDALEFIAQRYGIKVSIDARAQPLIDPSIDVRITTPGIRVRRLLGLLLKQSTKPLTFEVRDGALVIIPVSPPKQAAKAR